MSAFTSPNVALVRSVVETVSDREVTFLAAAISYYILVSLVPLLTLTVVVATVLGGAMFADRVQAVAQGYLLPTGSSLIVDALENRAGQGALSVVSLVLTVWGALKLFRGVDVAFARIYGYPVSPILRQLSDGLVALATLGGAAIAVAVATAVVAVADVPYLGVVGPVVLLVFLVGAFLPLYAVIPDVSVTPRQALPGAVFAAIGWTGLSAAFSLYARISSGVTGALGAVLLLVTWFYFSGILVLTGAVVNAVLADRLAALAPRVTSTASGSDGERRVAVAKRAGGVDGSVTRNRDRKSVTPNQDRQVQQPRGRRSDRTMSADDATTPDEDDGADPESGGRDETEIDPRGAPDVEQLDRRVEELRADLADFEAEIESRTVDRPAVREDLKRYVRGRMRRGKARGWGPYLVLLYGTVATISAFYFLDDDLLAVVAMVIIYLSTLGLYTLFVVFGVGLNALGVPGRFVDWVRDRRS